MKSLASLFATTVMALSWSSLGSVVEAVDEGSKTKHGVGIYVYKSVAPYMDHIKHFIEPYNGAHYYVQTKYSSDYWNAIGTINLRNLRMNLRTANGKNRVACISLNVLAKFGGVDIGIENEGDGWFAFFYSPHLDKSDASSPYNRAYDRKNAIYKEARKITFSIDAKIVHGKDVVIGHFSFYGSRNRLLGKETLTFYVPQGQLYTVDHHGNPVLRFTRFMSLLPYGADNTAAKDVADYSYMRNARFTGLQLYHREHGYQVWNMNHIDYAWSVQTANIEKLRISPRDSGTDTFSIYHSHAYHRN